MFTVLEQPPQRCNGGASAVQAEWRAACNRTFVMVAWKRRRRSGARTISSKVKWRRNSATTTLAAQQWRWRNNAATTLVERRSSDVVELLENEEDVATATEPPPPRCSGDATMVKPERRLGCSGRRRKDLDVVWGCSEKKKIEMVYAAAKGFRVFLTLRSHTASVNSKPRHIVLLYALVGNRPEAKRSLLPRL